MAKLIVIAMFLAVAMLVSAAEDDEECGENEHYDDCPPEKCDGEYCPKTRDSPQSCSPDENCGSPRCVCDFNYKRDRNTGACIRIRDCPPFECNGPNEEFHECPPTCPENCTDYLSGLMCRMSGIGFVAQCAPSCRCKRGYYRNSDNICVEANQC